MNINKRFFNKYFPWMIVAFAFVIYLYLLKEARHYGLLPVPVVGMDQYRMLLTAVDLYHGKLPPGEYNHSLVYTLFLLGIVTITQGNLLWMRIIQAAVCSFGPFMIYKLCRRIRLPFEVAQISAVLYCFYGPAALLSLSLLRAVPLGLCFVIYVFYMAKAFMTKRTVLYVLSGFMGAVCIMGRPNYIPVVIVPVAALVFPFVRKYMKKKFVVAYFLTLFFTLLPLMIYNYVRFERFSTNPGHLNNIVYDSGYFGKEAKETSRLDIVTKTVTILPERISEFCSSYEIPNSLSFYSHREVIDFMWMLIIPFNVLLVLATVSLLFLYKNKGVWLVYSFIVFYAGSIIAFPILYRYRFPVLPLMAVLAGPGLFYLFKMKKQSLKWAVLIGVTVACWLTFHDADKQRTVTERKVAINIIIENKQYLKAEKLLKKLNAEGIRTDALWHKLRQYQIKDGLILPSAVPGRLHPQKKTEQVRSPSSAMNKHAGEWLKALKNGKVQKTIQQANVLLQLSGLKLPEPKKSYQTMFQQKRIQPRFLSDSFNYWDYVSWTHAAFFKQKAEEMTAGKKEPLKALIGAVHARFEPREGPQDEIILPYYLWQRKYGLCDRQCWVVADLAYQLGYETRIIWLLDPQTGVSPHTICEIRKPGFSAIADPLRNIYLANQDIYSLAGKRDLLQTVWPDKPLWHKAIVGSKLMIPAYAQDYCPRNQLLYQILKKQLGDQCPRFGSDPKARLNYFETLAWVAEKEYKRYQRGLYGFPLVSFRQMLERHTTGKAADKK